MVIAETETGNVVLLTAAELDVCAGSIEKLTDAITAATRLGLKWQR